MQRPGHLTCGVLEECTASVVWGRSLYAFAVAATSASLMLFVLPRIIAFFIGRR